jgi:DnaJ-class molecular chaperone
MIALLFRVVFVALILGAIYFIMKMLSKPADYIRCSRCDGKGFWYAARGKEKCDWCKGSGKLSNR